MATAQATRFGVFNCIPAEYRKTPAGSAASGAFAGGVSVLAFQGIDVIKSRMQGLDAHKYASSLDCLRTLVREEGVMALYKGIGPRMTRAPLAPPPPHIPALPPPLLFRMTRQQTRPRTNECCSQQIS